MYKFEHIRTQHPVGQGSFHSAKVTVELPSGIHRFDYVYDCGGLSGPRRSSALERAVANYEPRKEVRTIDGRLVTCEVIDALVLSHFDRDHMNGAELLTERFFVERIYVPYLSPLELAVEIGRQAGAISAKQVGELFAVANGGQLWGVEVTRVAGGPPDEGRQLRLDNGQPPVRGDGEPTSRDESSTAQSPFPLAATTVTEGRQPIGKELMHAEDVLVEASGTAFWQLRFWNIGVSEELAYYVLSLLDAVGFPVEALEQPDGATAVVEWLKSRKNRDAAIDAYVEAIRMYSEPWAASVASGHVPNLVSLALFSGPRHLPPAHNDDFRYAQLRADFHPDWWPPGYRECTHRVGWLGTGDAPLGEAEIWKDFAEHFRYELPRTRTVLLPHHGAAPSSGPAYYNPNLNAEPRTVTVLSVGLRNPYGHPKDEVLAAVIRRRGLLTVVTDEWPRGFSEFTWGPEV